MSYSTNNSVILLSPKQLIITQEKKLEIKKDYTFDGLFEIDTPKEIFYERTTKPIIDKVLEGYNGSIICYGETGTGKTYTINEIIPQAIKQIFDYINESDSENELFKIDVSIIEIYKEQVNDLLDIENKNLNLINNKNNQLIIDNLTHIGVSSDTKLTEVINKGITKRKNNSQKMKDYNSKSHFIIILTLFHFYKINKCIKNSKLFLVDLEGSERLSKAKGPLPEGESLEEQKLINKSLIALSIIVQNLSNKNDNINYAPYRDSKLTRIISDSFGGNCYTSLILNCSKHEYSTIETRNTLMFGEKAKKIRNNPKINFELQNQNNILLEIFNEPNELNENEIDNNNNLDKNIDNNMDNNKNSKLNINNINNNINKNDNDNGSDVYNDSQLNFKNLYDTEMKFLKVQLRQLKDKIEQDNTEIQELKERNAILENEKKNLMDELEQLLSKKRKEDKEDKLNCEYIKNNINDLHELLNEKENNEKNLKNEIYSLKLLLEKKNMELSDIINEKNREIKKIRDTEDTQVNSIFQELVECLDQTSDTLDNKDKKISELINIINIAQNKNEQYLREINELKLYINELKANNNIIIKKQLNEKGKIVNSDTNINNNNNIDNNNNNNYNSDNNDNINNNNIINDNSNIDNFDINLLKENNKQLNVKIMELVEELKNKEKNIISLNEEKEMYLKKKGEYENRINGMSKLINKMKDELDNKNISLDSNDNKIIILQNELNNASELNNQSNSNISKLINENDKLKNQIQSLKDNYTNISINNEELINKINQLEKQNEEKINKINQENNAKINELQNEINENNKTSIELHNLKIKNQNLNKKILLLQQENKKLLEYENLNNNLKNEILLKDKNIEEIKLKINSDNSNNLNIIENLKKDIISKNNIIIEQKRSNQELEKENNNIAILKNNIEKSNNIINELKNKYEALSKENEEHKNIIEELEKENNNIIILKKNIEKLNNIINDLKNKYATLSKENEENKNIIEELKNEIIIKNKIIEKNKIQIENDLNEIESNKNIIIKLKKEIASTNNLIIEYKLKIENLAIKEKNAQNKINNLENELLSKDNSIHDYKIKNDQILEENNNSKIIIQENINNIEVIKNELNKYKNNYLKIQELNDELLKKIEIIKETHIKEINKYKEIISQKETEINSIKGEYINSKQSLEKILELQKKITELKIENNQLLLKIQEYQNNKIDSESDLNSKKDDQSNLSFSFQGGNNKIKSAYQALIEENEQLKDNILNLRKYNQ